MSRWSVLLGDCIAQMRTLDPESVQTCVTSPPYWGLRDYGVDGQRGLEATPEEYVSSMVDVFREVRRVLREDGTLWLNLGDTYAVGGAVGRKDTTPEALARRAAKYGTGTGTGSLVGRAGNRPPVAGLKPKDLVGIPWMVAFALRADGWFLRSDIIWHKPNPMPESVTDRPTKAHEYLFLLTKSERYAYDAASIAETATKREPGNAPSSKYVVASADDPRHRTKAGLDKIGAVETRNARSVWTIGSQPCAEAHFAVFPEELPRRCVLAGSPRGALVLDPFTGSGTTGIVALKNGRCFVGCELNPEYHRLASERIGAVADESTVEAKRAGQIGLFGKAAS